MIFFRAEVALEHFPAGVCGRQTPKSVQTGKGAGIIAGGRAVSDCGQIILENERDFDSWLLRSGPLRLFSQPHSGVRDMDRNMPSMS